MSLYPNKVVGILGGGQLGRMLVQSASLLNIETHVLDKKGAPAKQINDNAHHVDGSFTEAAKVEELAKNVDVLTVEIEHVDTYALEKASETQAVPVEPHWRTIRIIQNKFKQKEHLQRHDIAVAEYEEVKEKSRDAIARIGEKLGYPFMLKSQTGAYDGKGNSPVHSASDIDEALKVLDPSAPLYAEKWANFKMELAVMVVKTKDQVLSFPTVETVHEDSICKLTYAPARNVSKAVNEKAQALARDAIAAFEGKGVFGVEMFLLEGDKLLVNEIAPRPHNSGHYTIEACATSQYEAHLRAILDLPITQRDLRLREPAVMLNILGGAKPDSHLEVAREALKVPDAAVHLYGKGDGKPGRKMGHLTVTCPTMSECETAIQPLVDLVDDLRAQRTDLPSSAKKPSKSTPPASKSTSPPLIAVIMGSDSDLPVLETGLTLLADRFHIPLEVRITSAHRTPEWMAEYVASCAPRGVKAIIAAAGGAAHLPGMASGHTYLPVIGVPVKGKVFDGLDSIFSEVQMPPGVPTAIVGVNNSMNAALYALRILAASGCVDGLAERLQEYIAEMRDAVLEKDKKMSELGWREYLAGMQRK